MQNKYLQIILTIGLHLLISALPLRSLSQYILNGSAIQNTCNCYTLTQPVLDQSGSVWNSTKINLTNSFDFNFNVYLGCDDQGADGIAFILQPLSTSLGTSGGGMGFSGIVPSIGISLDTWQNLEYNDPAYDHVSIQANGIVTHGGDLAGPIQASATSSNIEDCAWHVFRISWDAGTKWLRTYFDGTLRLEIQVDLTTTIFHNDPLVYWGFGAATGGAFNLQQFCTALNPKLTTSLATGAMCFSNTPITFQDQSISFAPVQSWYWDFGDATTSSLRDPPPHLYTRPGIYQVKHVIKGLDGCVSDTLKEPVAIGSKPTAAFNVFDTCLGKFPRIADLSKNEVGAINQWTWVLDDTVLSTAQQPLFAALATGEHQLKLVVKSVYNCISDTASATFRIRLFPVIDMIVNDGCRNEPVSFRGLQLDTGTLITQWNWRFGDGRVSRQQNPMHSFAASGQIDVSLFASDNYCPSPEISKPINITFAEVRAINDTIVTANTPFSVGDSFYTNTAGPLSFSWSPVTGLDNPYAAQPTATLKDDITYVVTVTTIEGCKGLDTVNIKVFKGSAIYVPTGFSPNGDGLNDRLRPLYVGIKRLDYFKLFNRWGRLVFSTSDLMAGWDGRLNGTDQPTGSFVWVLKAQDIIGKVYEMRGTTTIIR